MPLFTQTPEGALHVRTASEQLLIQAWGDGLRIRATHAYTLPSDPHALEGAPHPATITLFPERPADAPPTRSLEPIRAIVRNGPIEVRVAESGRLSFYATASETLLLEEFMRTQAPPRKGLQRTLPREFRPIPPSGTYATTARFESNPSERLYGMGQYQQPHLNLKGTTLELIQRNSQTTIPFVLSSLGYGFLWNNPAQGSVTFATNLTAWHSDTASTIDYWITAAPSPAELLAAYGRVTGFPPAFPEWALGFWQSRCRYRTQDELLTVARRYHERGIPLAAIVLDYFHWLYEGDLDFDRAFWPDPKALVDELRSYHIEPVVSIWPTVDFRSTHYPAMRDHGFLARVQRGPDEGLGVGERTQFTDVTNPDARAFVWNNIRSTYRAYGFRAFWLDLAEPETATPDPDNFLFAAGSAAAIGNRYPLDYTRMFFENLQAEGETQLAFLTRSAWAGSQKHATLLWSGDIPSTYWSLRNQLSIGLSAGLAGIPWWNCDAGGFFDADSTDPAFHELLIRWFSFCTFTPVLRLHGARDPFQPGPGTTGGGLCPSGADNEIWSYGPEVEAILLEHIHLRERLRPYLRRLFHEAQTSLTPLMRPMFFGAPNDPACASIDDQYFFGPDLIVAPIFSPNTFSRPVTLPTGSDWQDIYTHQTYPGGTTLTADAPLAHIPVFQRATNPVL